MTAVPPASYMRIVSFSIVAFDMLQTLPGEYRLYRRQWENRRISLLCIFFFINRYGGATALITNAIGFFSGDFTQGACNNFYLVPVIFKMIAGWAATGIIFLRTWAISRRSKITFVLLMLLTIAILPLQIISNFYKRYAVVGTGKTLGNCTSTRLSTDHSYNWAPVYYLAALIWDVVACCIATYHLVHRSQGLEFMAKFTRRVLKHGVLYCLGVSLINLLVYLSLLGIRWINGLGATVNIAVTMILAQHLVLTTYTVDKATSTSDPSNNFDDMDRSNNSRSRSRSKSQDVSRHARKATRLSSMPGTGGATANSRFSRPVGAGRGVPGIISHSASTGTDRIELGAVKITTVTTTDSKSDEMDRKLREREEDSSFERSYAADAKRPGLVPQGAYDDGSIDEKTLNSPRSPHFNTTGQWRGY